MTGARLAQSCDQERRVTLRSAAKAFTLIDLLVSIAVIAVLIGILLPSLSGVRETTRQVVCRSNERQLGIGIAMFADANHDMMPSSRFAPLGTPAGSPPPPANRTTIVRTFVGSGVEWDGLGHLFAKDFISAPGVFYCPSHTGNYPYSRYANAWDTGASDAGEIVSNFQYRGWLIGSSTLSGAQSMRPTKTLIADAIRTQEEYNHRVGANLLRADLSALWFNDPGGSRVAVDLPHQEDEQNASEKVIQAWDHFDDPNTR